MSHWDGFNVFEKLIFILGLYQFGKIIFIITFKIDRKYDKWHIRKQADASNKVDKLTHYDEWV